MWADILLGIHWYYIIIYIYIIVISYYFITRLSWKTKLNAAVSRKIGKNQNMAKALYHLSSPMIPLYSY